MKAVEISRRWKLKPVDAQVVHETRAISGLPEPLAHALALRGYQASEEIEAFLNPRLSDLSDPFLLPNMEKAAARIWKAINDGERISIFGDYDVDGVTATAILTRVLNFLGADANPFIPDRLDEGYGLSRDALDRCLDEHGSTLIITVDCGTNSAESVAAAQARGVDVIITDHHEPGEQPADAYTLINPKLSGMESKGDMPALEILSGAGLAFKLAHALIKVGRDAGNTAAAQVDLRDFLDIVALGTVADMVPLIGENRIIVRHGLKMLDRTRWEGLRALKAVAGIRGHADTYHLGFQLGPRINAAGRIGQPLQALRLLVTDDADEARRIAKQLDETNSERQRIERHMVDDAFAEIDAYFDPAEHFGLVVAREGWHPGIVGIVASRVSRRYNRPSVILGMDADGHTRGSCRSIDEFDVLSGLHACERHLLKFGGHRMAAGVELSSRALDAFASAFNKSASSILKALDLVPVQHIDAELTEEHLDWCFFKQLKRLHPFGQDNPEPIWALRNVDIVGQPRVVGQKHLKLSVAVPVDGGRHGRENPIDAIAFNYSPDHLPKGKLDIAFTLKENRWNGNASLQLQIKDIRAAETPTNYLSRSRKS